MVPFALDFQKVDPEGRYVFVQGSLDRAPLSILGLYAPNFGQLPFLLQLEHMVEAALSTPLLIGGISMVFVMYH